MSRLQYWTSVVGALLCCALVAAQIALTQANAATRGQIAQRQQYVQQSLQLEGLYREIVRALAELSARHQDQDLRALLQRHGITYNVAPAPATAPAPAAGARK